MVALQRAPIATAGAGALIRLPFCDLNVGENPLNAGGDFPGFGQRQSELSRAQPFTVDPDDLVHVPSVGCIVKEDDLYRHPDHREPRTMVNACSNEALIAARGNASARKGSRDRRRDTACEF
jgi:hypothetical protein